MKFGVCSLALLVSGTAAGRGRPAHRHHLHHLRSSTQDNLGNLVVVGSNSLAGGGELGNEKCLCIGFDDVVGDTTSVITHDGRDVVVSYPGDLGASCEAWDAGNHPFCKVDPSQGFCKDKWCYVDPKHCEISVMPKISQYQPSARFQTMPLYYSYATCDAKDTYTKEKPLIGGTHCRCIGFQGSPGMTVANIGDKQVEYPSELGGECKAWDAGHHPECMGAHAPDWCEKPWCFVDPCSCHTHADVPPKVSGYLGDATFQGKPVFWSYATCGSTDTFSEHGALEKSKKMAAKVCRSEKKNDEATFGEHECPCIGFDGVDGETIASITHSGMRVEVSYPADLGGSCDPWDSESHPSCKGDDAPDWCKDKWCYVDPKNCHIPVLPKESSYQSKATFQALPLYYSYSTCGAKDIWTQDAPNVGEAGCRCIGIDGMPGSLTTTIDGKQVSYPAEMGGQCKAWDSKHHPSCQGQKPGKAPSWCPKKWCYVDPCSCSAAVSPKTADFLGQATFQGRAVFWSYSTCGETDDYSTAEHQSESKQMIKNLCSGEGAPEPETKAEHAQHGAPKSAEAPKSGAQGMKILLSIVALCFSLSR